VIPLPSIIRSHDIVCRCRTALPRHLETVIEPLPPGRAIATKVATLPVRSLHGKTYAALRCGQDLLLLSYDGPAAMTCGDVDFDGTALLLESRAKSPHRALAANVVWVAAPLESRANLPHRALMIDGRRLTLRGTVAYSTDRPTAGHALTILE